MSKSHDMVEVHPQTLTGRALDWAVAKCEGFKYELYEHNRKKWENGLYRPQHWQPSTDWAQGGPIIERENLCVGRKHQADTNYCEVNDPAVDCWARTTAGGYLSYGPTLLIAAMRCYVASKLGMQVSIPRELLEAA